MFGSPRTWAVLLATLLCGCASRAGQAPRAVPPPAGTRTATLLAINDVYRIEGLDAGARGGFARLRTLRAELERTAPDLLVFHAGDLLFPSLLSRVFNGEQMIDVLNRLDGAPGAFDSRFFVVFGNHEFEKDKRADAVLLQRRVRDSQFRWVNGNVDFALGDDGQPLVAGENLAPTWMTQSGGIKIGVFGLTVDDKKPQYVTGFRSPSDTARALTRALRAAGAEVVIALTHLRAEQDRALLHGLGADGPDLVLGGHDHDHLACDVDGRKLLKADADARTATVVTLRLPPGGKLEVTSVLRPIDTTLAEDCATAGTVAAWLARHEGVFCSQEAAARRAPLDAHCLDAPLGVSKTLVEAEESAIRARETGLGDWIADRMRESFAGCGADAAIINSGSLRLNQDLAAGVTIRRRHLEELFAYPTPVYQLRIDGATLERVLAHAIAGWPGNGNWLQVSGLAFDHDTAAGRISNVRLATAGGGWRAVQPGDTVRLVVNKYLFDPAGDRDGYTMLNPDQLDPGCAVNASNLDLKLDIVQPALQKAGSIAPGTDGRIHQVPERTAVDLCTADKGAY